MIGVLRAGAEAYEHFNALASGMLSTVLHCVFFKLGFNCTTELEAPKRIARKPRSVHSFRFAMACVLHAVAETNKHHDLQTFYSFSLAGDVGTPKCV